LHRQIGEKVAEIRPDLLVLLGDYVSEIAGSAQATGFPAERVAQFPVGAFAAAVTLLQAKLTAKSLILVKGSRSLTLEKIVNPLVDYFGAGK
jgi:UDP-N-acetylmuramyl pentapeptide synthase